MKIEKSYRYRYLASLIFLTQRKATWFNLPKNVTNRFNSYTVALEKNSTIKVNILHKKLKKVKMAWKK